LRVDSSALAIHSLAEYNAFIYQKES